MADEPAPAPAEDPATPAPAPVPKAKAAPTPDDHAERLAGLIRNGLSNTAVSQSPAAWQALESRLPEIVAAILKEA